ncbi:MAG: glycosyltransferase family 4 protein [Chitinophagaceae bacterium]|nr:glycosyltransferase family 4 protein [Chitinophagaceae bacterium]
MKATKTIGFNGSMLDEKPTGVGVYTYNIINNLQRLYQSDPTRSLEVFTPSRSFLNKSVAIIKLPNILQSSRFGKTAALTRFLWNLILYPVVAKRMSLLVSPTTHGSLALSNQLITIHDLLSLRYDNISKHQRFYFTYVLPRLVKKTKKIIAISESTKKDVVHFLNCPPEHVKVIYNGYDKEQFYQSNVSGTDIYSKYKLQKYILAIGPTYPHKNFATLLHAYAKLPVAEREMYPLVIAGGMKKYLRSLEAIVNALALQKHVHFLGYVPQELMRSLYTEALMLVFPSLYEGFGFPLLEAMACGCPVASSQTSSMPEVCGNAAIYFDPLSADSILSSMRSIIVSAEVRNNLITKGLERAKLFSWEKAATEYKTLIDEYLN